MADAMISALLDQLLSITREQVEEKVKLVMGVDVEVDSLRRFLVEIRKVLMDAERRQLKDEGVRLWLDELKDVSYDIDTIVDEWNAGILKEIEEGDSAITKRKVCFSILFSCFNCSRGSHPSQVLYRLKIAKEITNLKGRIDNVTTLKDTFDFKISTSNDEPKLERPNTTSILDVPVVYGQDKHKQDLLSQLLSGSSQEDVNGLHIISIVGMGGLGKTTLAKQVYNNDDVKAHFGETVWVCVSDPFEIVKIAEQITEQLNGQIPQMGFEILMQKFHDSVKDRKFLLVLDDVWTNDYSKWAPLESALRSSAVGSRVVVTTRKEEVAKMIGSTQVIRVDKLSDEDCWTLLSEIAFFGKKEEDRQDLAEVGRQIAQKCDGLPLAAKTLGGLLRIKTSKDEWLNVLKSDLWKLENVKDNLFNPLLLSYYELPSEEKRCFSYCAIFPKDYEIDREDLIRQWIAQGYFTLNNNEEAAEVTAQKCFDNLAMRSFFQDFEYDYWYGTVTTCKMHDIVHDFAQFLTLNEFSAISIIDAQKRVESNVRHLNLMVSPTINPPVSISNKKQLHSLMATCRVPDQVLDLKRLRTLSLTGKSMTLPTNIGELIHLRYLSVYGSHELKTLPPTIGNLINLQTLRLLGCNLEELPEEVGELINVRHLYASYKRLSWSRGIGRLKCLQTLKWICISPNNENFQLQDLRNLNSLRVIYLEDLGTDEKHVKEAMEAQLCNKRDLINLSLGFKKDDAYMEIQMNVLEALQPHENLKYLQVSNYMGRLVSSSWMISLINLENLFLFSCHNCEELPPFGKLPSLVSLRLFGMKALRKLGPKFLGIENDNGAMTWDNKSNGSVTLFPKLKQLIVEYAESLSVWVGIPGWKANGALKIMPRLEDLYLGWCWSLQALPDFLKATPLKKLTIFHAPALERSCEKETGKDWPKIRHVPNIRITS